MMEYIINHSHTIITNAKNHRCNSRIHLREMFHFLSLFFCVRFSLFRTSDWDLTKYFLHSTFIREILWMKVVNIPIICDNGIKMAKWFVFYETIVHVEFYFHYIISFKWLSERKKTNNNGYCQLDFNHQPDLQTHSTRNKEKQMMKIICEWETRSISRWNHSKYSWQCAYRL